jgi:hypothetical protein
VRHGKTLSLPNREDEACPSKRGEKTRRGERHTFASAPAAKWRPLARLGDRAGGREENAAKGRTAARGGDHPEPDAAEISGLRPLTHRGVLPAASTSTDNSEQRGLRRLAIPPPTIPLSRRPQLGRPLARQPPVRRERKAARRIRGRRRLSGSPRPRW